MFAGCDWNIALRERRRTQRVIAKNVVRLVRNDENEDAIGLASHILAGLRSEIPVQALNLAGEAGAIVVRSQRLDLQIGPGALAIYRTIRRLCLPMPGKAVRSAWVG